MYGLKQAAIIAYLQMVKHMDGHVYYLLHCTAGLLVDCTLATHFFLCVEDFGVKYFSKDREDHLLNALKNCYAVSTGWEGGNYPGLKIDWYYKNGHVDVSMPDFIPKSLDRLQHQKPNKPHYATHKWTTPAYGQRLQC